jgi:hypothetical protein
MAPKFSNRSPNFIVRKYGSHWFVPCLQIQPERSLEGRSPWSTEGTIAPQISRHLLMSLPEIFPNFSTSVTALYLKTSIKGHLFLANSPSSSYFVYALFSTLGKNPCVLSEHYSQCVTIDLLLFFFIVLRLKKVFC